MPSRPASAGRVYLVGAGPGDPGMLTLRAVECLRRADLVLYDYLVNPAVLHHAPADAERHCLGRHGHEQRIWSQQQINERMIDAARQGRTVVRLKGGDPVVFARLAEEVDALRAAAIELEIVAGVTVATAAGSFAGIPLTHRDHASAVALITGQQHGESASQLDYAALARFPGTLVVYMGVTTVEQWAPALIAAGKPADTPAAIVRRCSFPDQQTVRCTLGELVERLTPRQKIPPPVVVVIGPVAAESVACDWFSQRPLCGVRVLVTRPSHQADALRDPLLELGAEVLHQPAIEISEPDDWAPVDAALDRIETFDWLVFSSVNGVRMLLDRLLARGADLRRLGPVHLAAIGPGTAAELARYHLTANVQPAEFRAESLAESLAEGAAGRRFLLARASRGREVLAKQLQAAGGTVEQVVVYRSDDVTTPDADIAAELSAGRIDWITVTSSAIARSLIHLFGDELRQARLVSISPITSGVLRDAGFEVAAEAQIYTMEGVVAAIAATQM